MLPDGKLTGVPFRRKRGYRTGIESIHHIATYDPNGRKSLIRHPGPAQCFFNRAKRLKQSPKFPRVWRKGTRPFLKMVATSALERRIGISAGKKRGLTGRLNC